MQKKVWYGCIGICFFSFLTADFFRWQPFGMTGSQWKFLSMLFLCCSTLPKGKPVLLYTLFCDFLLLFTARYETGVAFFIVVHLCYLQEMDVSQQEGRWSRSLLLLPLGIMGSFLSLETVVVLYIGVFLYHWIVVLQTKENRGYATGLLLFTLCDCCTAISYATGNFWVARSIWLLYLPAQILLTIEPTPKVAKVSPLLQIKSLRLQNKK